MPLIDDCPYSLPKRQRMRLARFLELVVALPQPEFEKNQYTGRLLREAGYPDGNGLNGLERSRPGVKAWIAQVVAQERLKAIAYEEPEEPEGVTLEGSIHALARLASKPTTHPKTQVQALSKLIDTHLLLRKISATEGTGADQVDLDRVKALLGLDGDFSLEDVTTPGDETDGENDPE